MIWSGLALVIWLATSMIAVAVVAVGGGRRVDMRHRELACTLASEAEVLEGALPTLLAPGVRQGGRHGRAPRRISRSQGSSGSPSAPIGQYGLKATSQACLSGSAT